MPDRSLGERIVILETTLNNVLPRMETYMKQGTDLRATGERTLGRIESNTQDLIKAFDKYSDECTVDRLAQGKRITSIETKRYAKAAIMALIYSIGGSLITASGAALAWVGYIKKNPEQVKAIIDTLHQ